MDELRKHFQSLKKNGTELLIGITGGIGSGKSTAAECVRKAGYTALSSDDIAKTIIAEHREVREAIAETLNLELNDDGFYSMEALAKLIFGPTKHHEEARNKLQTLVHPLVIEEIARQVEALFAAGERIVFNESALLYETGYAVCYDYIITVDASEEQRLARIASRGITKEEYIRRKSSQLSCSLKREAADFVLKNDGTLADLQRSVESLLTIIAFMEPPSAASDDEEE